MKMIFTSVLVAFMTLPAFADPKCTTEPKEKWQDEKAFEQSLKDKGYRIKKFKVTNTSCYEIYGWDKDGKKVEIYYNPVTGDTVKEIKK
ncbi:MAG: PepSY domain-containing protein [Bdellovibrionales bacterium]